MSEKLAEKKKHTSSLYTDEESSSFSVCQDDNNSGSINKLLSFRAPTASTSTHCTKFQKSSTPKYSENKWEANECLRSYLGRVKNSSNDDSFDLPDISQMKFLIEFLSIEQVKMNDDLNS
ncbi:unnamed protein product [Brachionus calyciflorus]|uniref:Uncharacterized protein n=1 Tax=Brachionus calyciflorus TaxID=104777 RepID=A0A813V777_9BILA|nr:unnamed protein product [Brachionus calyciflorus]